MQTIAHHKRADYSQHGLSLIELMVAITLGLLVLAATVKIFVDTSRSNQEMAKTNSQIENARFAMQLLQNDIVHGGFWGGYLPVFDDLTTPTGDPAPTDEPSAVPDPCLAYSTPWDNTYITNLLGIAVQAYNTAPSGCTGVVTNKKAGTDVLVVRHAETCAPGTCNPGSTVYFQPSFCETEIDAGSHYVFDVSGTDLHTRDCTTVADKRKLVSNIYYIRTYATTSGDGIPTLMRSQFVGTAHSAPEPLIEGIEDFRVEFGIDNHGDGVGADYDVNYNHAIEWTDPDNRISPKYRGDGTPDIYVHCGAGCSAAQLTDVVAVKLYVLARAERATPGYTDTKTYKLGSATVGPFNDGFKRHVFTTTVRLHNVSSRRETP